jgi:hypothetical protein
MRFGCTSASHSLYNLREAVVGSASNSSLAVPSKSVLLLTWTQSKLTHDDQSAWSADVGVKALNLLRMMLGSMGATPSDSSKISMPAAKVDDPPDKYFS